jgi:hypothetical protein
LWRVGSATNSREENKPIRIPKKIPIPPKAEIPAECTFLSDGRSYILHLFAALIKIGTIKRAVRKDVRTVIRYTFII